jgi:hypothetical protein
MTVTTTKFEIDFLLDYSDDALLDELRRIASIVPLSAPITKTAYGKSLPKVSAKTLQRRFGGWQQALESAGLGHRYVGTRVSEKMKSQESKNLSNEDLLNELRRVRGVVGTDWLTRDDFNNNSIASAEAVRQRFGSFTKGLELAGIGIHPSGTQQPSEIECFENLANVWTHFGRAPHFREMFESPSRIKGGSYETRWGTWRKALMAFASWANQDDQPTAEPLAVEQLPYVKQSFVGRSAEDRREVRPALRFKVFKRDGFRCLACGRSPATHLNIELHADHIIAVANGGKTIFENLQTLCQDCNLGKGKS